MTAPTPLVLADLVLDKGSHRKPDEGMCVMEAAAYLAGEPWSDRPTCVSGVLTNFAMSLNDNWDDDQRQKLIPFIPRMIGTAGDGQDEARGYLALDWLIRTFTPVWLDLAGLTIEAQELRELRRIVDLVSAQSAGPVVRSARDKAYAARDAARAAAWAAAGAAAGDAAWAAAGAAAGDAAGAAAGDAAWDAAWAAAGAAAGAARDVLQPTVVILQDSALELFDRMIDLAAVAA